MKPMRELNHYELLELPFEARPEEIDRAYALVREAYAPGSLASYSVLDEQEAAAARQQVETAFSVNAQFLMFPGDTSLNADLGNIVNCRCTALYEPRV